MQDQSPTARYSARILNPDASEPVHLELTLKLHSYPHPDREPVKILASLPTWPATFSYKPLLQGAAQQPRFHWLQKPTNNRAPSDSGWGMESNNAPRAALTGDDVMVVVRL